MNEVSKVALGDGGYLQARLDPGPDGGLVVVLSNSVLTDLTVWDGQVAALGKDCSFLRYDQRGHGCSSVSPGPRTFDDYGADLVTLLDAFDVESCVFVGLSMGVPTGLAAFARAPERFAAFVAVDGVAKSARGRETFWSERRETARRDGMTALAQDTAQRWLPGAAEGSDLMAGLTDMIAATPVEGFASASFALQSYDYTSAVGRLNVPFLAIAGAEDGAMPDAMRGQFAAIPGARFEVIQAAGHIPNVQCPAPFNAALLSFLRSLP